MKALTEAGIRTCSHQERNEEVDTFVGRSEEKGHRGWGEAGRAKAACQNCVTWHVSHLSWSSSSPNIPLH
eukprot:766463-Hanusia_phi.AAC.4